MKEQAGIQKTQLFQYFLYNFQDQDQVQVVIIKQ